MISYRSYFHKRCVCHAKFSSANIVLTESPGKDSWAQEKNVQNFIKVHFRLLTANPKAEALYLITETAKKKENIIQNILRPRGYYPSFVSTLICFMCPFKHQWKSSKRIKLKINCSCKIWELQKKKKAEWNEDSRPHLQQLPLTVCSETKGPVSEWKCLSSCQSNDCWDSENSATGNRELGIAVHFPNESRTTQTVPIIR